MLTYRIPKKKVKVVVYLTQGEPLIGQMFMPCEGPGGTPMRLSTRLADSGYRFLALVQEDGSRLLSRERIVRAEILDREDAEAELDPGAGNPLFVSCRLSDGSLVEGTVSFAMPRGRERLIDYLNSSDGFIPIRTGRVLSLINVHQVVDCATN